jgi:hypothetical protein
MQQSPHPVSVLTGLHSSTTLAPASHAGLPFATVRSIERREECNVKLLLFLERATLSVSLGIPS